MRSPQSSRAAENELPEVGGTDKRQVWRQHVRRLPTQQAIETTRELEQLQSTAAAPTRLGINTLSTANLVIIARGTKRKHHLSYRLHLLLKTHHPTITPDGFSFASNQLLRKSRRQSTQATRYYQVHGDTLLSNGLSLPATSH